MRTLQFNVWKAIAFFVVFSFIFVSCKPGDDPNDPDPNDPTPGELVKPKVSLMAAENVTKNTATLVGWVTGNEKGTTAYFSYKTAADADYAKKPIGTSFDTKDSIKVTFDLSMLQPETEYSFKLTAENKAGKVESIVRVFVTASNITATDGDGNVYKVIKIGNQYWMAENFKGTHFADGTDIENIPGNNIWSTTTNPARCWLNNDSKYKDISGGLYNSYVYAGSKKVINGWHVPSFTEVQTLINYLGGATAAMPKLMINKTATWVAYQSIYSVKTTNESGFTAIPSSYRVESGIFADFEALLIATTEYDEPSKTYFALDIGSDNKDYKAGISKNWGVSIRLVKD